MGNQLATPGKSNATSDLHSISPAHAQTVGKTTGVDQQHPTGDVAIDSGGRGSREFFTDSQRAELNRQTAFRLGIALKNYSLALMTLKVEQMIKKPEELGFFMMFLLGAVETMLTSYGGLAVKWLRKHGNGTMALKELTPLAEIAKSESKEATKKAEASLATMTEVQINGLIKSSLAKGKGKASAGLAGTSVEDGAGASEKGQAMSFIDTLMNEGDVAFDRLNRDVGGASDAIALAWWKSLDPVNHSEAKYEAKLRPILEKYLNDPASKIGRSTDWEKGPLGAKHVEKEVSIVRVLMPAGIVRYAEKDTTFDAYLHDHPSKAQRSPAYDASQGALSLEQDATWNIEGKEQQHHETPLKKDKILNFVDHQFEELAVKKQEHVWQKPIETYQMTFTSGAPRLVKVAGA